MLNLLTKLYLYTLLLLIAPALTATPVIPTKAESPPSCRELYQHLVALEKAHLYRNYSAYDDKLARLAAITTTKFTPAIIYIGYANIREYTNDVEKQMIFQQMEAVRYHLAQMNCFALK